MSDDFTWENFAAQFGGREIPDALVALWNFEYGEDADNDYYADGFELDIVSNDGLRTWSEDPEFLDGVIEFAAANGSGSSYGFWVAEGLPLAECPIVVFGDEGGAHVVAENLTGLLRLLSYDVEVFADMDRAFYYRSDDDEYSERHDEYVTWLRDHLQLEPVTDPNPIVERAQELHQERFTAWVGRFVDGG